MTNRGVRFFGSETHKVQSRLGFRDGTGLGVRLERVESGREVRCGIHVGTTCNAVRRRAVLQAPGIQGVNADVFD